MIGRINAQRAMYGLRPLAYNAQLGESALGHSRDMAAHPAIITSGQYHTGSDGSSIIDRIRRQGYNATRWGQIVGWGFGGDGDRMVDWWMNSPSHRVMLLSPDVEDIGVGYVYAPGSEWGHYWTIDFGKRAGGVTPPPPAPVYTSHVPIVLNPSNSTGLEVDLLNYLRGNGRAYMVQHPSGAQEKFRTVERPANRWLQLKNSQWEEFWYSPDFIWRGTDTSPGDGHYYRQFEDGNEGARWCPRWMTVGQSWRSPVSHTVQTYDKETCRPVDHHRNGRATNALTLAAHHHAMTWNDITVNDVVELVTHTGEHMYFARGYGLVAWAAAWGGSAISHLLPDSEADNQPESGCFG